MHRLRIILVLATCLLFHGCAGEKETYKPVKANHDDIPLRDRVKTIAVAPVTIDEDIPNAVTARVEVATLLVSELNTLGFQTIPVSEYEAVFNRLRDEAGGFYDPITGHGDKEKYQKVQDLCRRELAVKFHAEAVIHSGIVTRTAPFWEDLVRWDGVGEKLPVGRSTTNAVSPFLAGTPQFNGRVPVLSFCVKLEDINGSQLMSRCGGVQTMARIVDQHFADLPSERILTNHGRISNAVVIALSPLRVAPTQGGTAK